MKKILIITAHPSETGHTHKIANAYKEGSEKSGNLVEILDLYKTEHQLPYLEFEDLHIIPESPARKALQIKIMWADELVFIHPLWWGWMPAIMKNFIDHCFETRFAYRYVKSKPVGLLTPRTAKVFITVGGSMFLYRLILTPFKLLWKLFVIEFCGLKLTTFWVLDKMARPDQVKIDKFIKDVRLLAERS